MAGSPGVIDGHRHGENGKMMHARISGRSEAQDGPETLRHLLRDVPPGAGSLRLHDNDLRMLRF